MHAIPTLLLIAKSGAKIQFFTTKWTMALYTQMKTQLAERITEISISTTKLFGIIDTCV